MQVPPGTYTVTTVGGNDLALIEYAHNKPLVFGCYEQANSASNQRQWYLKPSSRGEGYVLQNVWSKWYIKLDSGGQHKADFYGATIWNLDHGSGDSYKLSVLGTSHRMGITYPNEAFRYVGLIETNVADGKSHLWKLEKLSDDAGESPPPPPPCAQCNATHCPPVDVRPNNATDSANSISYPDDEHCYTDALFNMPRAPFTRAQRLLALDWARNLGGKNVPTITSFDECERRLDGRSGSNPAVVPSQPHGPPAGRATAVLNQPVGSYKDGAHLYTDMLFNMPRTPLAPTQRIAALNWARQLGANNVPTTESFDECERELETR